MNIIGSVTHPIQLLWVHKAPALKAAAAVILLEAISEKPSAPFVEPKAPAAPIAEAPVPETAAPKPEEAPQAVQIEVSFLSYM